MLHTDASVRESDELANVEEGLILAPQPIASPIQPITTLITSKMNSRRIMACLVQHGCNNITACIDLQSCGSHPFARGGFGAVYRGTLKGGQPVAIKCIETFSDYEVDPEHGKTLKRAAREIYTWSRCHHQGVLPMLGFIHFRGQIALVTPWIRAGSLKQHIFRGLSSPPLRTCIQLATAVEYLHKNGIVHGDIKPDNILVTDQGQVQLADFGNAMLALATTLSFTRTNCFHFTTRFAAPEVLKEESRTFTKESDVYALGMTMFNIMTGQTPFADKREVSVIIEVVFKKGQPSRPDFGDNLKGESAKLKMQNLFEWCFSYEPRNRPQVGQVKEALMQIEKLNNTSDNEVEVKDSNDL